MREPRTANKPGRILPIRLVRWALRLLGLCVLLSPFALLAIWMTIQHIPSWYQPALIAPHDYQKVRDDFESAFNEMSASMMASDPFRLVLRDRQLTNWLAMRGEILPEAGNWLPDYLQDPVIRFERGRLLVAGTVTRGGVSTVITLGWTFQVEPKVITARLDLTRTGSLPLPQGLVARTLARIAARGSSGQTPITKGIQLAGRLEQAATGLTIENRFRWKNGDRLFRITGIDSADGALRLNIQPLDSGV